MDQSVTSAGAGKSGKDFGLLLRKQPQGESSSSCTTRVARNSAGLFRCRRFIRSRLTPSAAARPAIAAAGTLSRWAVLGQSIFVGVWLSGLRRPREIQSPVTPGVGFRNAVCGAEGVYARRCYERPTAGSNPATPAPSLSRSCSFSRGSGGPHLTDVPRFYARATYPTGRIS